MKFILGFLVFASSVAHADSITVFSLQRLNYKPEKKLIYDINYDATTCELNLTTPFDVYYRDNTTGERLTEFSNDSAKYFGPRMQTSVWTAQSISVEFTALDEIKKATNSQASIIVTMRTENDICAPVAEYRDGTENYVLKNIDIQVRKVLGFPVGVAWVHMTGESAFGLVSQCAVGTCN